MKLFIQGGGAIPTGQLVPEDFSGHVPALKPDEQNLTLARHLLAEAGYPQGFRLTLHDKDARRPILEAIAKMLSEAGIKTDVETFPPKEYFDRVLEGDFSATLSFYQASGQIKIMLFDLIKTGASANDGRYSNPELDQKMESAAKIFDPDIRMREYSYAMEQAMKDYALIPLYFINDGWVIDKNLMTSMTITELEHFISLK